MQLKFPLLQASNGFGKNKCEENFEKQYSVMKTSVKITSFITKLVKNYELSMAVSSNPL